MNLELLNKLAVKQGIPSAIIEKDYALSVVLQQISTSGLKDEIVFKGGTALKKAYFAEVRFSEDLDFSVMNVSEQNLFGELAPLFVDTELNGVKFMKIEREKTRAGLRLALKFSFLLSHPQRIRFDFSFRDNLALKPEERFLFDSYGVGEARFLVLSLEELFAEKVHALFSRVAARDLYDSWYLFKNGITLDIGLLSKKFAYYNERFEPAKLKGRIADFRYDWYQDLAQFMKNVPEFDDIAGQVLECFENWKE